MNSHSVPSSWKINYQCRSGPHLNVFQFLQSGNVECCWHVECHQLILSFLNSFKKMLSMRKTADHGQSLVLVVMCNQTKCLPHAVTPKRAPNSNVYSEVMDVVRQLSKLCTIITNDARGEILSALHSLVEISLQGLGIVRCAVVHSQPVSQRFLHFPARDADKSPRVFSLWLRGGDGNSGFTSELRFFGSDYNRSPIAFDDWVNVRSTSEAFLSCSFKEITALCVPTSRCLGQRNIVLLFSTCTTKGFH